MQAEIIQKPDAARDWKRLVVLALIVFGVTFSIRILNYGQWDYDSLRIDGDPIMGTHDAYHWLAGAKGFKRHTGGGYGTPMAETASLLSKVTGLSLSKVGFWAPVFFGSLVAVVTLLWAWLLGGLEAGVAAGILAGLVPAFFFRTRFGYYDTDIITLLFPLTTAWLMALGLKSFLRPTLAHVFKFTPSFAKPRSSGGAKKKKKDRLENETAASIFSETDEQDFQPLHFLPFFLAGVGAYYFKFWHSYMIIFSTILFAISLLLILLWAKPGKRAELMWGVVLFVSALFWGTKGMVLGTGIIIASYFPRARTILYKYWWIPAILAVLVTAQWFSHTPWFSALAEAYSEYVKPTVQTTSVAAPKAGVKDPIQYPAIVQSIIEGQNVPLTLVLQKLHPWYPFAILGFIGFVLVSFFRPWALLLAPLTFISLTAVIVGSRTIMFGGPGVFLGLALPLGWLIAAFWKKRFPVRNVQFAFFALFAGILVIPLAMQYYRMAPTPVITNDHAKALKALSYKTSEKDAMVWTWWDWGYATQFYAQRRTFADGGLHSGEYVFPLGLILTSNSPLQASQIMKYLAFSDYDPGNAWADKSATDVQKFLISMGYTDYDIKVDDTQYILVTAENLRLASWISYFGTWDLVQKKGVHAKIHGIYGKEIELDTTNGVVLTVGDEKWDFEVRTLVVMGSEKKVFDFPQNTGPRVVVFPQDHRAFFMEEILYKSMMCRLLVDDPDDPEIDKYFRLVYEGYPNVRVYEVR